MGDWTRDERFEYELTKAREQRDFWKAEYDRLCGQLAVLRAFIEDLHTMVDPDWMDE